ncbi:MAG: type II secretion system F family protein [Candidatus Tyrphobacter sp.]
MIEALYRYCARSQGLRVTGTMYARSEGDAVARLRARRLFVTSLHECTSVQGGLLAALDRMRSAGPARVEFLRALAILVSAGTPLLRALTVAGAQCKDARFAETLRALADDVRAGASLSDAMSRRPTDFPQSVVAMVRVGELGGVMDDVLVRCANAMERSDALARQMSSTLAYPLFVLAAAALLVGFLLAVTVPGFASILAQLHAAIPWPTRLLLAASERFRNPLTWIAGAAIAVCAFALCAAALKRRSVAAVVDRALLRLPVAGRLRVAANVAAFSRTASTLLQCGLAVTAAVEAAAGVVTSIAYRNAAALALRLLNEGVPLSSALERTGVFDGLCVAMAAVGEESGSLDATMLRVAEYFELELQTALRGLASVVEPALILVLGAIVGGIVGSILVPLYGAVGSIR